MGGFVSEDLPYPWIKAFKDETWEGSVSYSWLGEHIGNYRYTGDTKVFDAVCNCWEDIKYRHLHITGGPWSTETPFNTNKECFADATFWTPSSFLETCSTITWVQLNCLLLEITGHAKYAEEVERTFLNRHLGSHTSDCNTAAYFSSPNDVNRNYGSGLSCCNSSLPRVYAMIATHAYMCTDKGLRSIFTWIMNTCIL